MDWVKMRLYSKLRLGEKWLVRLLFFMLTVFMAVKLLQKHGLLLGDDMREKARALLNGSKLILMWSYYDKEDFALNFENLFETNQCEVDNCKFTADRSTFDFADAVIFTPVLYRRILPTRTYPDQIYVMYNMEPPTNFADYPFEKINDQFNLTFTYLDHPDTDIPLPMGYIKPRLSNITLSEVNMAAKTEVIAWVVSNCNTTGQRHNYVQELSKYITVDIFGKCGTQNCSDNCFEDIGKRYKFYLAFEKAYCDQYLTEKMYRTLNLDLVPVALGGARYSRLLPNHSYIDVRHYNSPKDLASHLKWLDRNDDAYLKFFNWKKQWKAIDGRSKALGYCRLCKILNNQFYEYKSHFNVKKYWDPDRQCLTGREERRALHLK